MPLSHRQIETFRAVMLTGSLTQAALGLHTSQPTVSRVLADLGRAVGFPLFQRQGRRVAPTREATRLFEEVERSYHGLESIERAAATIRRTGGERVRVAAVTSVCIGLLPKAVAVFRRSFPDVALVVEAGRYDSILTRVLGRHCDLGIAIVPDGEVEAHVEPLIDANAVCVLPANHPLCRRSAITPRDLADHALIFVGQDLPSRRKIDAMFAANGLVSEPILEVQSGSIACAMVAEGLGIAVLDALTVLGIADNRIQTRPLRPAVGFRYSVMMPRTDAGGRLVGALIAAIKEAIAVQSANSPHLAPVVVAPVGRRRKSRAIRHIGTV
ncbi:MAG: LysR family transcriptional regulator [Proteobacteria bacterium]|nr:LysR family transcriptional regulator [Pseudomonadota bacterium]